MSSSLAHQIEPAAQAIPPPPHKTRCALARVLRLHHLLSLGERPPTSRLAAEFEVSAKTIKRDVQFMRDHLGLPIEYDFIRNGWYYTRPVTWGPSISIMPRIS